MRGEGAWGGGGHAAHLQQEVHDRRVVHLRTQEGRVAGREARHCTTTNLDQRSDNPKGCQAQVLERLAPARRIKERVQVKRDVS